MRLDGKVAIVTGASEGIGAALAKVLQQRGAMLSLVARSEEQAACRRLGPTRSSQPEICWTRYSRIGRSADNRSLRPHRLLINNAGAGLYAPSRT